MFLWHDFLVWSSAKHVPFLSRVVVELAIPCANSGPRVFKGFTVGFHPRSSEVVKLVLYLGVNQ